MNMLDTLDSPPLVTPELIAAKSGGELSQIERILVEEVIVMYERKISSGELIRSELPESRRSRSGTQRKSLTLCVYYMLST